MPQIKRHDDSIIMMTMVTVGCNVIIIKIPETVFIFVLSFMKHCKSSDNRKCAQRLIRIRKYSENVLDQYVWHLHKNTSRHLEQT